MATEQPVQMKLSEPYNTVARGQARRVIDSDSKVRGFVTDEGKFIFSVYSERTFTADDLRNIATLMDTLP